MTFLSASGLRRTAAWATLCFLPACGLRCTDDESSTSSGPASGNILVSFPGTTSIDPPLLLFSGWRGSICAKFEPHIANPTVLLEDVSSDADCPVELDAFTPELGAWARDVDTTIPGDDAWLSAAIVSGALAISPPAPVRVPIQIWLVANAGSVATAETLRDRLLDKAYPVLATMGSGLSLDTVSATLNPTQITANCASAGSISTNSAIYDASRINVYFVNYYGNNPGLTPARNCWIQSHPEIVFISWGNPNVTDPTLVHELGHALGLIHPTSDGGHTNFVSGFSAFNLMATNTDVTDITVGQLYAMSFSSDSWLNRSGSPLMGSVVRTCSNTWEAAPCPSLKLLQVGWPP
jgi:hypothetical protein